DRAVTPDDFKAMAEATPGVDVARVAQPRPVTGGAEAEAATPARSNAPVPRQARKPKKSKKPKKPQDSERPQEQN
ncbi:MAG: hypothetical protein KDI09_18635, partial [Halioglobus sp.]|nr:hypothetical protein [Halioglobus sp.]